MVWLLTALCMILLVIVLLLILKLRSIHKAAEELCAEFEERLNADTNVGISISTSDCKMQTLAADIDRQLKLLRKEHIRYTCGDRELKNAITGISHDLRTPLTAISGYMELLSEEEVSDTVREYLSVIENRVQALKELTEELFRYSVILSVDSYEAREEVSLNKSLEECMAAHYAALKEAGIEPEIRFPQETIKRQLNPQALSRILANLVGNAMKYSDGDLRVHLYEDGTIVFANRAENLDGVSVGHLFDRFFTVENARHSTGLGLSIAKTLTEEMKGQIEADYRDGILKISLRFPEES